MLTAFKQFRTVNYDKDIYCSTLSKIFIKYKIINNDVNIIVNSEQRPATCIVGSQGDHITAYTVLLQTICNVLDGVEESLAPSVLYESISCFCENLASFTFTSSSNGSTIDFFSKLEETKSQIFSANHTKEVINSLSLESTNINKLKNCIALSNKVIFAELIVELAEQILINYNKQATAALPKILGYNDKQEGSRIKQAMLYLKLLNRVIKFKQQLIKHNPNVLINNFKQDCYGLIKSCFAQIKCNSMFNKKFNDFVKKIFLHKLHMINLDSMAQYVDQINLNTDLESKKIGELFNDLFDFKQSKFRTIKKNNFGYGVEQEGQIVDNGAKIALKDPLSCLYEATARHENFMFIAFSGLNNLSQEIKNNIIDGFHEKIIAFPTAAGKYDNNQGWGEWIVNITPNQDTIYFTKNDLDRGVQEFHNKHPRPMSYSKAKSVRKLRTMQLGNFLP